MEPKKDAKIKKAPVQLKAAGKEQSLKQPKPAAEARPGAKPVKPAQPQTGSAQPAQKRPEPRAAKQQAVPGKPAAAPVNTAKKPASPPPKRIPKPRAIPSDFFDEYYHALPLLKKMQAKKALALDVDIDKVRYLLVSKSGMAIKVIKWGVQKFPTEEKNLLKALQIALENIRAKIYKQGMEVYASIFSTDVNIRQIILPKMAKTSDLEKAIFYRNQSDLQNFDEQSIWSYRVLQEFEHEGTSKLRVIITVVPGKTVHRYLEIFENSRLVLKSMVPRQAAIMGAYHKMAVASKRDMLIDISYDHCQICYINHGRLEYIRNLGIGARNLEIMIRDGDGKTDNDNINLTDKASSEPSGEMGVGLRSRLLEKVKDLQQKQNPVLHTFFSEILRSMAFVQGKGGNQYVDRLLITGYGLRKESLIPYLRSRLNIPIMQMAPQFYPGKSRSLEFGEFFSTLGTILQPDTTFNILPDNYKTRLIFQKLNWLLIFVIILSGVGLAYYSHLQNKIWNNQQELVSNYQEEYNQLNPVEGMYRELAAQISTVSAQNRELRGYVDAQPPMLEIMRLFSNETPREIIFQRLHFQRPVVEVKGNKQNAVPPAEQYWVDVEGIIKSDILLADVILINFINRLNELGYFKGIQLNYSQKNPEENITMFGFRVTL